VLATASITLDATGAGTPTAAALTVTDIVTPSGKIPAVTMQVAIRAHRLHIAGWNP
jgi:hypothetical protein